MVDPWTALNIAANIYQFIESGVKLVVQTKAILDEGIAPDYRDLLKVTTDLDIIVNDIAQKRAPQDAASDEHADALVQLAIDCQTESSQLVQKIRSYLPTKEGDSASWRESLCIAVRTNWQKHQVEDLEKRVNWYRSQVTVRLIASLNAKLDVQGSQIEEIQSITRSINSSVEAIGAVLKLRDGSLQTILNGNRGLSKGSSPIMIVYKDTLQANSVTQTQVRFDKIAQKILDALWFELIESRQLNIEQAFNKTFEWIFKEDCDFQEWDHFPTWLQTGTGCYWINGKPGSGKSTLMRFIGDHPELRRHLRKWAGEDDLLIATYYFWRVGQDLQKSQHGLLRSLLYQILDKRPELVTVCFPELCRILGQDEYHSQSLTITFDELRKAFSRLITQNVPNLKLFIMIDGVDEYQGDYDKLTSLILQATQSETTKIIVSSRPTSALSHTFSAHASLQLQDLTIDDIKNFTQEKLVNDSKLQNMNILHPGFQKELTDGIASKALGVFLWVTIVTKKVLEKLGAGDDKDEILRALEGLPNELEELYAYMFASMSAEHRADASLMIQLFARSHVVQSFFPMTAIQLSFANEKYTTLKKGRIFDEVGLLLPTQSDARIQQIEDRLRSRCVGLLEVSKDKGRPRDHRRYVFFLHRTVMDFFENDQIWKTILSWNADVERTVDEILLCACMREIIQNDPAALRDANRTYEPQPWPDPGTRILHGFVYTWTLHSSDIQRADQYRKQLWDYYRSLPQQARDRIDEQAIFHGLNDNFNPEMKPDDCPQPVLAFAAAHGSGAFSAKHLEASATSPKQCSLVLLNILTSFNDTTKDQCSGHRSAEQLAAGAKGIMQNTNLFDPNAAVSSSALQQSHHSELTSAAVEASASHRDLIPWTYWLICKQHNAHIVKHHPRIYVEILEQMLQAGALIKGEIGHNPAVTVKSVIESCLDLCHGGTQESIDLRNRMEQHLQNASKVNAMAERVQKAEQKRKQEERERHLKEDEKRKKTEQKEKDKLKKEQLEREEQAKKQKEQEEKKRLKAEKEKDGGLRLSRFRILSWNESKSKD